MPDPQEPRRPQRKPSDWSPRPIPQPAAERRTADPETPPLRELQAREQQRASLVANADSAQQQPTPDDPCAAAAAAVAPKELRAYAAENIPRVVTQARAAGLSDDQIAYVLGTVEHESGFGKHMVERNPLDYEGRTDLGNTHPGDGRRFIGRGFVQITGRTNYTYWGKRLKLDLVQHPELATDPTVAAAIAVRGMSDGTFTGKKLDDYVNEDGTDYVNARRIVNGTDQASTIAKYASRYQAALQACRRTPPTQPPAAGAPPT